MNLYFNMAAALAALDGGNDALCPVNLQATPTCFVLDARPQLLQLDGEPGAKHLGALLDRVPLYRLNLELALDAALLAAGENAVLAAALTAAFSPAGMPTPSHSAITGGAGALRHPLLEHMTATQLAALYIRLVAELADAASFGFPATILRAHLEQFSALYDGYLWQGRGTVKAAILVRQGRRPAYLTERPLTDHIADGQQMAQTMAITDAREALWAWLDTDLAQLRRCRDIDALKMRVINPTPVWVRDDVFALLKKEAMKQQFADIILSDLTIVAAAPQIAQAILANAQGQVDDLLQKLLSQTLNVDSNYAGAAGRFADQAQIRREEAVRARLV